MFYDDDGHACAFDVSTTEQELAILEGICKECAKAGRFSPEEKSKVKESIANKNLKLIYEILSSEDIHLNSRGSPSIVNVESSWRTNTGIIDT